MGPRGYSAQLRRKVLDVLAEGRSVASVADDLHVSDLKIYNWRGQERIDRGEEEWLATKEKAPGLSQGGGSPR